MRFHKIISVILHPIVMPTIGLMLYFLIVPNRISSHQKLSVLSLVFILTYLIPVIVLILFKRIKLIKSYQINNIRERKIPVGLMIILFYLLGKTLGDANNLADLSLLFYSTSLALLFTYILFYFQIKASIHLLSFGISITYFLLLGATYAQNYMIIVLIMVLLAGILASARLHLNAHKPREIYIGFFAGAIGVLAMYFYL